MTIDVTITVSPGDDEDVASGSGDGSGDGPPEPHDSTSPSSTATSAWPFDTSSTPTTGPETATTPEALGETREGGNSEEEDLIYFILIACAVAVVIFLVILLCYIVYRRMKKRSRQTAPCVHYMPNGSGAYHGPHISLDAQPPTPQALNGTSQRSQGQGHMSTFQRSNGQGHSMPQGTGLRIPEHHIQWDKMPLPDPPSTDPPSGYAPPIPGQRDSYVSYETVQV